MLRTLSLGLIILFATTVQAFAACTLPYTLTNGQTADASQVMANLNAVVNCVSSSTNFTGGYLNKFRNGTMDVWQRGAGPISVTTAGAYTADGWIVIPAAAGITAQQATGRGPTVYSLKVIGAAGVTDATVKQRIESVIAAPLAGVAVTVQAEIYNNTGAAITPTLTVKHASGADAWTSPITDVNAVSLQPCPNGSWTQVAYTFTASSSSGNGLEISFDFGNNFGSTTSSVQISEADVRATPGTAVGLNNTPPAPELRPISAEIPFCQRYFQSSYPYGTAPGTANQTNSSFGHVAIDVFDFYDLGETTFQVQMRTQPTIQFYNASTGSAAGTYYDLNNGTISGTAQIRNGTLTTYGFNQYTPSQGLTVGSVYLIHWTVSSEL